MEKEIREYVKEWERRCYKDGIPDIEPDELWGKVPSYRRIAMAILTNDIRLLGLERKQSKYYGAFKRIEISRRTYQGKQYPLF